MNSKQTYLLIGLIIILILGAVALVVVQVTSEDFLEIGKNNGKTPQSKQSAMPTTTILSISSQAKRVVFGNTDIQPFYQIILDPGTIKMGPGVGQSATQTVAAVTNSDFQEISATLTDGNEEQQKEMKSGKLSGDLQDRKAYYLKWRPKNLSPGETYPVRIQATTQEGILHSINANWEVK